MNSHQEVLLLADLHAAMTHLEAVIKQLEMRYREDQVLEDILIDRLGKWPGPTTCARDVPRE